MTGKMSRNKGQRAEREFCKILQTVIDDVYVGEEVKPKVKRNLMQTAEGGYDVKGIDWLALEVKHQEALNLTAWWKQTLQQAKAGQIPVLAYKQNRKPWRIRMPAYLGADVGALVEVSLEDFLRYFSNRIQAARSEVTYTLKRKLKSNANNN